MCEAWSCVAEEVDCVSSTPVYELYGHPVPQLPLSPILLLIR